MESSDRLDLRNVDGRSGPSGLKPRGKESPEAFDGETAFGVGVWFRAVRYANDRAWSRPAESLRLVADPRPVNGVLSEVLAAASAEESQVSLVDLVRGCLTGIRAVLG